MSGFPVGAAIAGGVDLIGSIGNWISGAKNRKMQIQLNRENNQFNAEQAKIQRDWTEQMYKDYQSPQAMRSQYEEAGYNPYLAMSQGAGSVGSGSGASAAGIPTLQAPQLDFSSFGSTMASIAQAIKLSKEASGVEQNYMENWNYLRAQADKLRGDTNWLNKGLNDWKPSFQDLSLQQDLYRKQAEGEITRIDLANDVLRTQKTLNDLDADTKRLMGDYLPVQLQMDYLRQVQELNNLVAEYHGINARTDSERARKKEIIAHAVQLYQAAGDLLETKRGKKFRNDLNEKLASRILITEGNELDSRNTRAMADIKFDGKDRELAHQILFDEGYQMEQRSRHFLLQLFSTPLSSLAGSLIRSK